MSDTADSRILEETNDILDAIINRMRQISNNLLPDALLRQGLVGDLSKQMRNAIESRPLLVVGN